MKKYFYVYYSYEEFGLGYIGSRICECLPEDDIKYFGSFRDKTFHPTNKIILKIFDNNIDMLRSEVLLHNFYQVDINPHFANKAKQTSEKFFYRCFGEENPSKREDVRDKIRSSKLGENNPAKRPEVRQKLKEARRKRIISEETKNKMSEAHKGKPGTYGMKGKKHSEETKQKMREYWKKRRDENPRA